MTKPVLTAEDFLNLARRYFDGGELDTNSGICLAMGYPLDPRYAAVVPLLKKHGFMQGTLGYMETENGRSLRGNNQRRKDWAPRAWVCLFMAEIMKGKGK